MQHSYAILSTLINGSDFSYAGLVYTPTSVMFVNVPSISSLQWHPFTISSNYNLEPDNLSVIIKKEGSWSQKLYKMLSLPLDRLDVSVEGPYGPAAVNFLRFCTLNPKRLNKALTPRRTFCNLVVFF